MYHFNNYDNISKKILKNILPILRTQLEKYKFPKNTIFELWYKDKEISVTNYSMIDKNVSKMFKFEFLKDEVTDKYITKITPKNIKIIQENKLFTVEQLETYYNTFKEEYTNNNLIKDVKVEITLYKALKEDYWHYDEAIYELDSKEATLKKLKNGLKLYQKTIRNLEKN